MENIDALAFDVTAVKLRLDGAFDERIAELQTLLASLAERDGVAKTLYEANKLLADAQDRAKDVAANALQLKARVETVSSREELAFAKECNIVARERALAEGVADLDDKKRQLKAACDKSAEANNAAAADLASQRSKVERDAADLKAQKDEFNKKLAALKA